MKVKTRLLKDMLSKLNGLKPSTLREITQYYEISFHKDSLEIKGTDGTNYVFVTTTDYKGTESGSVIVKSDQLTKLIGKTSKEEVTLTVKDNYLEVKGNGTYKVEIVADEVYPTIKVDRHNEYKLNTNNLLDGIKLGRLAKSPTSSDGVLFNFLIKNGLLFASDAIKVYKTEIDGENLDDIKLLIPPQLSTLLSCLSDEQVTVYTDKDNTLVELVTDNITVVGPLAENAEGYPIMTDLFEQEFTHTVSICGNQVIAAVDRLHLFLSAYDDGVMNFVFTETELSICTSNKSIESIPYVTPCEGVEFVCSLSCKHLKDAITCANSEIIEMGIGNNELISITTPRTSILLAVSEEE
jgi:DNA polymerase III sliding clamp (beta) subunit (PCNA family)